MSEFNEPWKPSGIANYVETTTGDWITVPMNTQLRDRIVACVNACASASNEELAKVGYAELKRQRDELVRLVNELAEAVDNRAEDIGGSRAELDILRDAVKAAGGEK